MRRKPVLYVIAFGLALMATACKDVLDEYLCRPPGQCPHALGRNTPSY
jgi:hypothetical protein